MSARRNSSSRRILEQFPISAFVPGIHWVRRCLNSGIIASCLLAGPGVVFADQDVLHINTGASGTITFDIELASTFDQRRRGLMYRRYLAQDSGMLFVYDTPKKVSFWMKNTYIPLDILFIDRHGVIVKIQEYAQPQTLDAISSVTQVLAVLEINAGLAKQFSIQTGDSIEYDIFKP